MDPDAIKAKGHRPSAVKQAYVERFELKIGERAALAPNLEGRVYGTIMTLTHPEDDPLYSAPGPSADRPEPVLAQLIDGTAELALCFSLSTVPERTRGSLESLAALQSVARCQTST
jgi:hypothetical protein